MGTTPEESCPICERAAKVGRKELDEELVVDCRTCGDYSMGEDAPLVLLAILKRVPNARLLISYCIRQAQHSNKRPLIDLAILMAFADHNTLPGAS